MPATTTTNRRKSRGLVRIDVDVTTDASGVASATDIGSAYGRVVGIYYDGGLDVGATVTLKCAGATVYTITTGAEGTAVNYHRPTTIALGGAAATMAQATLVAQGNYGAANFAIDVHRDLVVGGTLSLTVASGGNVETGKFSFVIDEEFTGGMSIG